MSAAWHRIMDLLRPVRSGGCETAGSDSALLARFATTRDHDAFAELVGRHGRMVLGVSRQVLGNDADADDVFQTVFLILARKAGRIGWHDSVAGWLYDTTLRVCHRVRRGNARRAALLAALSSQPAVRSAPVPAPEDLTVAAEDRAVLLDELGNLPAKYRDPLVLCHIQGETCEEAARLLGCPVGTVKVRVSRAKERLRELLARRGVTVPVAAIATTLASVIESARISAAVVDSTTRAAVTFAAGTAGTTAAARLAQAHFGGSGAALKAAVIVAAIVVGGALRAVALTEAPVPPPPARPILVTAPAPPSPTSASLPTGAVVRPISPPPAQSLSRITTSLPTGAVRRLGDTRFRHGDQVRAVAFSADGSRIISASADHSVVVWSAATGRDLLTLLTDQGRVTALALLPGDTLVTVGEASSDLLAWDLDTGKPTRKYPGGARGYAAVAASNDGKVLAAAGTDKVVYVWDAVTGKQTARLEGHAGPIVALAINPDGSQTASLSHDPFAFGAGAAPNFNQLIVWDTATGKQRKVWDRGNDPAGPVAFTADGKHLAAFVRGMIEFADLTSFETAQTFDFGWKGGRVVLTPDAKALLTLARDGAELQVWDAVAGKLLKKAPVDPFRPLCLAVSPDRATVVAGGNHRLAVWDAATGTDRAVASNPAGPVNRVAVSPDGKLVAVAEEGGRVVTRRLATGEQLRAFDTKAGRIFALRVANDGGIMVGSTAGFSTWDGTGKLLRSTPADSAVHAAAISPDGNTGVWGGVRWKGGAFDLSTGKARVPYPAPGEGTEAAVFSPDGKWLALTGVNSKPGVLCVYETETFTRRHELPDVDRTEAQVLAFSPDGKYIAVGGLGQTVAIWEPATGKRVRVIRVQTPGIGAVAFSPDGKYLATAGGGGIESRFAGELIGPRPDAVTNVRTPALKSCIQVWDAATGNELLSRTGHAGWVTSLAFTPDGRRLVSGSTDSTAFVWDLSQLPVPGKE